MKVELWALNDFPHSNFTVTCTDDDLLPVFVTSMNRVSMFVSGKRVLLSSDQNYNVIVTVHAFIRIFIVLKTLILVIKLLTMMKALHQRGK